MLGSEIILGLASIAVGGGMLYLARARRVPDFVKLFIVTGWPGVILGFCTLLSGVVLVVAGIVGWDIWPPRW